MPLPTGWDDFARWAKGVFQGDGRGICVLSEVSNSPSLADMRARLKQVFPKAEWFRYSPVADAPCLSEGVFPEGKGEVLKSCVPDLSKAKVILAINIDLFGGGNPMAVKLARDFAAGRRLYEAHGGPMNRLYVVESVPTVTGAMAPTTAARSGLVRLPISWHSCGRPSNSANLGRPRATAALTARLSTNSRPTSRQIEGGRQLLSAGRRTRRPAGSSMCLTGNSGTSVELLFPPTQWPSRQRLPKCGNSTSGCWTVGSRRY